MHAFLSVLRGVRANLILSGVPVHVCVYIFPLCIAYGNCTIFHVVLSTLNKAFTNDNSIIYVLFCCFLASATVPILHATDHNFTSVRSANYCDCLFFSVLLLCRRMRTSHCIVAIFLVMLHILAPLSIMFHIIII